MKAHLYIAILLIALTGSCKDEIDILVPFEGPQLVIHGFLQPDNIIYIQISESRHILDQTPFSYVTDARVELFEDRQSKGYLDYERNGWYRIDYKPTAGKTYAIEVTTEKYGKSEGETFIPPIGATADFQIFDQLVLKDTSINLLMEININEPENEGNYYEIILFANNNDKYFRNDVLIHEQSLVAPVFLEQSGISKADQFITRSSPSLIFSDLVLKGPIKIYVPYWQIKELKRGVFEYNNGSDIYKIVKNDSLLLYLNYVDENYYYYRKTLDIQTINKGNPFAEPITVFTNIKNGYGIFAGFNTSRYAVDISELPGLKDGR
jgi:hypothetical protein